MPKKIAIIGPESTGKSTLCQQLAKHYDTLWCPEYAREYLLLHGTQYSYDDLLTIARGQVELEEKYIQLLVKSSESGVQSQKKKGDSELSPDSYRDHNSKPLFIDTDMYVMKVWCEFVFGKCHQFILDEIATRKYDLYFLCNVDLPWTSDVLREYPDFGTRKKLYEMYKSIIMSQPIPWVEISGDSHHRLDKAIQSIDSLLKE